MLFSGVFERDADAQNVEHGCPRVSKSKVLVMPLLDQALDIVGLRCKARNLVNIPHLHRNLKVMLSV